MTARLDQVAPEGKQDTTGDAGGTSPGDDLDVPEFMPKS